MPPFIAASTIVLLTVVPLGPHGIGATPIVQIDAAPAPAATRDAGGTMDWSTAVVDSTLRQFRDPTVFGSWEYSRAFYLYGQYLVFKRTGDIRYLT
jgi:unsaturated rhamnogalacturonyl hydrolase